MRIGSLTFPSMGSMRGQFFIILSIPINSFKLFFHFSYYFLLQPPVFLNNYAYYLGRYPDSKQKRGGSVIFSHMGPMKGQSVFLMP